MGDVSAAIALLQESGFLALTGAGLSTDSGIPDYRGPDSVGKPRHRSPMTYAEFVSGLDAQRRYWARSYVGWTQFEGARPNDGHLALADLERRAVCRGVVTQNVDGLHEQAGTSLVVALHGRIAEVRCLSCGDRTGRRHLQWRLQAANPGFLDDLGDAPIRPDGDVELADTSAFRVVGCEICGGALKPDVVFFGESVPRPRVAICYDLVDAAPALCVLGSSLTVQSGLRFVRHAYKAGKPVVIVNRGATRGDEFATHRIDVGTTEFLTAAARDQP